MNGKTVFGCTLIVVLIIATLDITEACKKCGQNACNCNLHHGLGGHHGGISIGSHHHHQPHSGLCHSSNVAVGSGYGLGCGYGLGSNLHGYGSGGVHLGGGYGLGGGLHVGGAYGVGGGLHVGSYGLGGYGLGGYGIGSSNCLISGYGSPPPVCNICGGYAYDGGYLRKRHWKPRCRCY